MPGVSRAGQDTVGGGTIQSGGQSKVYVEGKLAAVLGDTVAYHGVSPHNNATMTESSTKVYFGGKKVVRSGDKASCNHTATGSSIVYSN